MSDLAEHVAAIENDTTAAALDAQQRKRVYVGLYQSHLPRLDDADVIAFDKSRGHLELGPTAPQLATYLDSLDDDTRQRDPTPAGFVAVSGLVSLLGVAAGLVGVTAAAVLFVGLVVGVAGLAAVRAYRRGR